MLWNKVEQIKQMFKSQTNQTHNKHKPKHKYNTPLFIPGNGSAPEEYFGSGIYPVFWIERGFCIAIWELRFFNSILFPEQVIYIPQVAGYSL